MRNSEQLHLCAAGYPRAAWNAPAAEADRVAWTRWLKGLGAVLAVTTGMALLAAFPTPLQPGDATARMERLASQIERVKAIHPETARSIAQLLEHPKYDCLGVACPAELQLRNEAARARIAAGLQKASLEITIPSTTDVIGESRTARQQAAVTLGATH